MKIIIGIIIAFELIVCAGNSEFVKSYNEKAEQEQQVAPIEEVVAPIEEPIELTTLQKVYVEVEGKSLEESKAILNGYGIQFTECELTHWLYAETEIDMIEIYGAGGARYILKDGKVHDNIYVEPDSSMDYRVGWPGNEGWHDYEGNTREEQMIYLNEMETK